MSRASLAAAAALAVALAPALAAGQASAIGSAPLPPEKPSVGARAEPGFPVDGGVLAAGDLFSILAEEKRTPAEDGPAPGEDDPISAEEGMAADDAAEPSALLADPALAADLEALLAGTQAALDAAPTADAGDESAAPAAEAAPPEAAAAADEGEEQDEAATEMAWAEPDAAHGSPEPVEPPFAWGDGPLDAAGAARLFEVACLRTLPEFAGVGPFFDALGFVTIPGMRIRNHPQKHVSALASTRSDVMESGVRSCAILVEGLEQARAAAAVEALVAERFPEARRFDTPARGIAHVVWVVDTAIGPAKVTVTQSGTSSFIGATVLPPAPGAGPAGTQTDGS